MFEGLLSVNYLTSKNCFCYLSSNNFKHLQNNCLKLVYNNDKTCYVTVDPVSGLIDDHTIGIGSLYARALGIEEKSVVTVSEIVKPGTVRSATIIAINENDHYVLESLAENVQSTLLKQIRVISNGQKFVIWIGHALHVTVSVCDIKPLSPGLIDNLTEIVIKPPEKSHKHVQYDSSKRNPQPNNDLLSFLNDHVKDDKTMLRVAPVKSFANTIGPLASHFNVFASRQDINTLKQQYFTITLLNTDCDKSAYVRLYAFQDVAHNINLNKICFDNIFVSDALLEHFGCEIGCRLLLKPRLPPFPDIQEIEIHTKKNYAIDARTIFQQYLADSCKHGDFVLSSDVVLDLDKLRCFVRFQPPQSKFCVVTSDFVRNCKLVVVYESIPQKESSETNDFSVEKYKMDVANYGEILDKCLFLFVYNTRVYRKMYNVLITGNTGTGKSSLLKIVAKTISSSPYFISVKKVNCKAIKGKTVESLHKFFETVFFDLIHRQPSVLFLDDLQVLCENVAEGDALSQNAIYFNRVGEMLDELFKKFCEHNAVAIFATADSASNLNKSVYATRGNHLFKNVYNIKQLDKFDRKGLLEFLFADYDVRGVDFDHLSRKTESFTVRDVVDLARKSVFESFQEDHNQDVMTIKQEHCDQALEAVSAISLAGINLHPPGDKSLDDIGGLKQVKEILVETLLWPSMYPNLFTNSPLRLPSGLLLYGPPGTGKTIVAAAAAKHCGVRLISIKGPELLSKYIGASEQAVRDVFQRAQSAKPCVLFFDEFDSLAPRRGHDNTGVTDRVVNQLLTQLDGIESLSGVFVLAATSRPDLLDPALLRPGRLDIHIRCSLPDQDSRKEILQVLSKNLKLSTDVDLSELSGVTAGFSGADLQAVLYTAQLDSVKNLLAGRDGDAELEGEIHRDQLMEAAQTTRPSLTKAEQVKYERIYERFEGRGDGEFVAGTRATLA